MAGKDSRPGLSPPGLGCALFLSGTDTALGRTQRAAVSPHWPFPSAKHFSPGKASGRPCDFRTAENFSVNSEQQVSLGPGTGALWTLWGGHIWPSSPLTPAPTGKQDYRPQLLSPPPVDTLCSAWPSPGFTE